MPDRDKQDPGPLTQAHVERLRELERRFDALQDDLGALSAELDDVLDGDQGPALSAGSVALKKINPLLEEELSQEIGRAVDLLEAALAVWGRPRST